MLAGQAQALPSGQRAAEQWDRLLTLSLRHDCAPLFYYRLYHLAGALVVPQSALRLLREQHLRCAARIEMLSAGLRAVLSQLQGNGIEVVALKGLHLYGAKLVRPTAAATVVASIT